MKRLASWLVISCFIASAHAGGFGVGVGAYSPNSGLEDNDNAVMFGINYGMKFAVLGIKLEGWLVDSSGDYASVLGSEFGQAEIDIERILAADIEYYPLGTTFYLQFGVNHVSLDAKNVDFDAIDNELGLDLGIGATIFDKLLVQAKIMYTPDAIADDAKETLENLDDNLLGYMATVTWRF